MTTGGVSLLLIALFVLMNTQAKKRLSRVRWLAWLFSADKAVLQRINLTIMIVAGWGLAQEDIGKMFRGLNFSILGEIKLFAILVLVGFLLLLIDYCDGPGIKTSSYVAGFCLPIFAVINGGALGHLISSVCGALNHGAGTFFNGLI
ncbi:hypothetical protein [Microbispora sp. NPDC049125]|uniref:hypothetical protein n=1 Tax=Microbispora sp. NPDC049125 TaxID=3154929 RepID=UPI0034663246